MNIPIKQIANYQLVIKFILKINQKNRPNLDKYCSEVDEIHYPTIRGHNSESNGSPDLSSDGKGGISCKPALG